jgi:peptidyl-prolyl cis-trans isomerase D
MIQWMHALSKSWAAIIMMGALALSFVVWGIGDVFTGGSSSAVATIGGRQITEAEFRRLYQNFLRNQGQQMGTDITPDMAQKMGLPQVALQQLVSRTALDNEATHLGLVTADAAVAQAVRTMPGFRGPSGQFDRMMFVQQIQNAGYTEAQFLEEIRRDMTRDQLTQAVESNFVIPPSYAQALFLYINERRAVDYVLVSPESVGPVAPPSDAVLTAYIKANANRFSTPEYRSLEYAAITPDDVMASVTVSEQQIKEDYESRRSTYVVPERRDVQQIEFKTEAEASAARAKIAGGMSFEALGASRGLKPEQMSLGTLALSDLPDPDRAKAIFALPENEVSQPLRTAFGGFVLARVTKIAPGSTRTLDDVREEIRKNLLTQLAGNKLVDAVNTFTDARSAGDDLATAAKKAGMRVGRLTAVDSAGNGADGNKSDAPADPEFLSAAFTAEVGEEGDPFPTKAGAYYVLRVNGVTPPKLKTLEVARADATNAWLAAERNKLVAEKAKALVARAEKEKSLDGVARELKVSIQKSPSLARNTNDTMFAAPMVASLFSAAPDAIVSGPQGLSGNYIIARVTGVAHPRVNPNDPNFAGGVQQLSASVSGDFAIAVANAARARQGVKVNQQLVQSATGTGQ